MTATKSHCHLGVLQMHDRVNWSTPTGKKLRGRIVGFIHDGKGGTGPSAIIDVLPYTSDVLTVVVEMHKLEREDR